VKILFFIFQQLERIIDNGFHAADTLMAALSCVRNRRYVEMARKLELRYPAGCDAASS
jgi:hypothetical protein